VTLKLDALIPFGSMAAPAVPYLRALFRGDIRLEPDPEIAHLVSPEMAQHVVQTNIANLIIAIGVDAHEILPELRHGLRTSPVRTRLMWVGPILRAIGALGAVAQEVIPELIGYLETPDDISSESVEGSHLLVIVAEALGAIGTNNAKIAAMLLQCLERAEPWAHPSIALALWRITRDATIPCSELVTLFETHIDREDSERFCAGLAKALGEMGSAASAAIPILEQGLKHKTHHVRVSAAIALWKIQRVTETTVPVLMTTFQGDVDVAVIGVLGKMGNAARQAVPELQRIITSERRIARSGRGVEWADDDEALLEAAKTALENIVAI
jgi:HEAT repeat protein